MSLLVLTLPDTSSVSSVLSCAIGDEFTTLINYLTLKNIHFVKTQEEATTVGNFCMPVAFTQNQYLYFQSLDDGNSGVFYATIGFLVFVVQNP